VYHHLFSHSHSDQPLFSTAIDPLGGRLAASETVVFEWGDQQLLAGKRVSAGPQHIGAISITLPTAPVLAKIDAVRNQDIGVVIGSLLALIISRTITEPLREMQGATERITSGDFTGMSSLGSLTVYGHVLTAVEEKRCSFVLYSAYGLRHSFRSKRLSDPSHLNNSNMGCRVAVNGQVAA